MATLDDIDFEFSYKGTCPPIPESGFKYSFSRHDRWQRRWENISPYTVNTIVQVQTFLNFSFFRYIKGRGPQSDSLPTIGVEFAMKTVTLKSGVRVKVQLWDTGINQRWHFLSLTDYISRAREVSSNYQCAFPESCRCIVSIWYYERENLRLRW